MEIRLNQKTTTMKELDSYELLLYISWKEEDPQMASDALNEFYKRYYKYVYKKIKSRFKFNQEINNTDRTGYVSDVFLKVWKYASQFDPARFKSGSLDNKIKVWLGKIAENLANDYFEEQIENRTLYVTFSNEDKSQKLVPIETNEKYIELPLTFQEERLDQALKDLPERELDILFTYLSYRNMGDIMDSTDSSTLQNNEEEIVISIWGYNPTDSIHSDSSKPKKAYTESDAIDLLVTKYQTTRDNIRQIYSRTLRKLKKNLYNQE